MIAWTEPEMARFHIGPTVPAWPSGATVTLIAGDGTSTHHLYIPMFRPRRRMIWWLLWGLLASRWLAQGG